MGLNDVERSRTHLTAHILYCARIGLVWNWSVAVLSVCLGVGLDVRCGAPPALLVVTVLLLLAIALWLHMRIAFDARVFADWADLRQTPAEFDEQMGMSPEQCGMRSMDSRIVGARRLLWQLVVVSLLQTIALIVLVL